MAPITLNTSLLCWSTVRYVLHTKNATRKDFHTLLSHGLAKFKAKDLLTTIELFTLSNKTPNFIKKAIDLEILKNTILEYKHQIIFIIKNEFTNVSVIVLRG